MLKRRIETSNESGKTDGGDKRAPWERSEELEVSNTTRKIDFAEMERH